MHLPRLVLAAVALALAAPAGASAAKCPSKRIALDTPEVVVTSGKTKRLRGGGKGSSLTACIRATGRKRFVTYASYEVPGEAGNGRVLGLFGRNLLVEESGSGAESERTFRVLIDVLTGKRTEQSTIDGSDGTGTVAASAAGLLSFENYGSSALLTFRRPGAEDRTLSAKAADVTAIALGADRAYWRAGTTTMSAAVPVGKQGLKARPWRGPSEQRLRSVVPEPATSRVSGLTAISPTLLAYRFAVGARTAVVVYDETTHTARHVALLPGAPGEVAYGPGGIVATGVTGATLVTGTTVTPLTAEPASDPAISDPGAAEDGEPAGAPVAYWTTAMGAQSR